eukprot:6839563-Pyramimonas_sp.AAC.1
MQRQTRAVRWVHPEEQQHLLQKNKAQAKARTFTSTHSSWGSQVLRQISFSSAEKDKAKASARQSKKEADAAIRKAMAGPS